MGLTRLQLGKYRGFPLYGSSVLTFSEEAESDQRDSLVSVVRLQSTWEEPSYNCLQNLRTWMVFGMDISTVRMYVVFLNPLLSNVFFYYNNQHLAKIFNKFQLDFFSPACLDLHLLLLISICHLWTFHLWTFNTIMWFCYWKQHIT